MNQPNIHDRARQLVAQSPRPMALADAYSQLAKRRKHYGTLRPTAKDRQAFANVESQTRYLWQDRADIN